MTAESPAGWELSAWLQQGGCSRDCRAAARSNHARLFLELYARGSCRGLQYSAFLSTFLAFLYLFFEMVVSKRR